MDRINARVRKFTGYGPGDVTPLASLLLKSNGAYHCHTTSHETGPIDYEDGDTLLDIGW